MNNRRTYACNRRTHLGGLVLTHGESGPNWEALKRALARPFGRRAFVWECREVSRVQTDSGKVLSREYQVTIAKKTADGHATCEKQIRLSAKELALLGDARE
ncbi:MAG: hypothetical protein H6735_00120 [Alphaproteobacteria bacterium]|nr:hypothetical protein [Alphaproteobacteria bacterium]